MRRIVSALLLAAVSVVLSGCAAEASAPPAASPTAPSAARGPEVWGSAAFWRSPEGDLVLCPAPFLDSGWGGPRVCDDPLQVDGVDAADLVTSSAQAGESDDGWTWSAHVVTGFLDGTRFTVTGIDTAEALALNEAAVAHPVDAETAPLVRTGEEKSAARYALADPAQYGCAEPAGGWRDAGDLEGLIGPYTAGYPGQVVGWAPLSVADGVSVALIGAAPEADPGAVRAGMQTFFPDAACIVTSSVSAAELQSALDEPLFGPDPVVVRSGSDADGQTTADPSLAIFRTAPSDELDAAIARHPAGLVRLWTWFHRLP